MKISRIQIHIIPWLANNIQTNNTSDPMDCFRCHGVLEMRYFFYSFGPDDTAASAVLVTAQSRCMWISEKYLLIDYLTKWEIQFFFFLLSLLHVTTRYTSTKKRRLSAVSAIDRYLLKNRWGVVWDAMRCSARIIIVNYVAIS